MRLVDADALLAEYDRQHEGEPGKARKLIENAPTIERPTLSQFKRMAVQLGYEKVVHCKDCKRYSESEPHYRIYGDGNCRTWNSYVSEKGFCYYGERKTDEKV